MNTVRKLKQTILYRTENEKMIMHVNKMKFEKKTVP